MSHYTVRLMLQFFPWGSSPLSDTNFHETPRNLSISTVAVIVPQLVISFKKHLTKWMPGRKETRWGAGSPIASVSSSEKIRLNTSLYTPATVHCDSRGEIPFFDLAERISLLAPFLLLDFRLSCSLKQFQTQNTNLQWWRAKKHSKCQKLYCLVCCKSTCL